MSLERKERRRCDICKEVISGYYYSCERKYHSDIKEYTNISSTGHWQTITVTGYGNCQPPPTVDVCEDCWEELKKD